MQVMFGPWQPDLPPMDNTGVTVALNVIPAGDSYKSFPSAVVYSGALDARCQGAVSGRDAAGVTYNFAGDAAKLYSLGATAWSDASKVGGYTTSAEERWSFTQWGSQIIATNYADDMQEFTMGTSTDFADLSATAPRSRYISVVRNNVVAANTFDSLDGSVPYRVRWSGIGDATSWTPSVSTQSDFQDLDGDGGWCQQIVGGEFGTIFQERSIWRMTYVGSPIIYQFDEVERGRGTPAPGSVTKIGSAIPYLGIDGFYVFDGQQSQPIGADRIDKTFYSDLDQSYINRISSTVDPINKIIFWASPGQQNTGGNPNRIWAYNYSPTAKKRWAYADQDIEYIYRSLAEGYTLDGLDSISTNLDLLPFLLDSRVWTGNSALFSGFDSDHKQVNFTGTALDATIETQETELTPNQRTNIQEIRPFVEGFSTLTIQIGGRNSLADAVTWGSVITPNSAGNFPCRSNYRYHRMRVSLSGSFTHAQGLSIVKTSVRGAR
jgi:hypothetical protein